MKLGFIESNNTDSRHAGITRQGLYSYYTDPSFKGINLLTKPIQRTISREMLNAGDGLLMHALQDFAQKGQNTKLSNMIKFAPEALDDVAAGRAASAKIEISEPGIMSELLKNVAYPLKDIWFDLGNAICGGLKKIPGLKNSDFITRIQNSKPLKNHRTKAELTDLFYQITGMSGAMGEDIANANFLPAINKGLSAAQGNYSTKFERPLNRLATGLVSAAFVGRDFYNISMYQKNDKKEAAKSERKRFNQEVTRFSLNAFMTFITLGALSKYTNRSRRAAAGVLLGTALVSEIISRAASNVPLLPLTPKRAKEINQKRSKKEKEKEPVKQVFKGRPAQDLSTQKSADEANAKTQKDKNEPKKDTKTSAPNAEKAKKSMNKHLKILLKTFGAVVAGGFALAVGRKYSKSVNKHCTKISEGAKKFYNKITQSTVWAPQDNVNQFVDKLEQSGHKTLASEYRAVLADSELKAMRNGKPVYNLGEKDAWWGCFPLLVKKFFGVVKGPYSVFAKIMKVEPYEVGDKAAKKAASILDIKTLRELYRLGSKKTESGAEFSQTMNNAIRNVFNSGTKSQYSNTSLAMSSRTLVTLVSSYFFVNDFRNKVLIDSNGEDIEHAQEVTNTRIGHKVVNFFTNTFWMALFNKTFEKTYLGSLIGATAVATATELCNESTIRKSIGVPIKRMESRQELEEFENKNYNNSGIYSNWIKLISKLTGKKRLSEKAKEAQKDTAKKPETKA